LQNNRDIEYRGFVSLGQPPQAFLVVFGEFIQQVYLIFLHLQIPDRVRPNSLPQTILLDLLWVPAAGCKSSGPFVNTCKTQTAVYHPEKSLTAEPLNQTFDIEYGTGSSHGRYYKDKFAVSDLFHFLTSIPSSVPLMANNSNFAVK
jgi:hypothetical protein